MKNLPLSIQILLVFTAIILSISIMLSLLFPWILRDFFTKEVYATIENAQDLLLNDFSHEFRDSWNSEAFSNRRQQLQNIRTVNHVIILDNNQMVVSHRLPSEFLDKIIQQIERQQSINQRYDGQIGDRKVFYVITKSTLSGHDISLVSYMWDSYREDLVQTLFKRLIVIMTVVFLLSWIPSLLLAKYLSKPLVALESRVKRLANRQWHYPVEVNRKDEIGRLGESIELLRNQLIQHDESQQSFLQHISHELKTPVMVIRSYTQAIKDGIYPKGSLENTVDVIEEESKRLEKRIHNLLYLTKLDYLSTHINTYDSISMDGLVQHVVDRLRWHRGDLNWKLDLTPIYIQGDVDQWRVVLENILDNQIRYAHSIISISLIQVEDKSESAAVLHISNDGPPIEEDIINNLFDKFHKGYKGEFGLGLAIVQRIVTFHSGKIWAVNEEKGVSFYLKIPN